MPQSLWVNLETQKKVNLPKDSPSAYMLGAFYVHSGLYKRLENRGFKYAYDNRFIRLTKQGIKNSKNWQIAKQYPEVYKILKNGGKLYLMQNETDMDYTVKILQLFAPKGEDIFDGVTIPANYATDGQVHTVSSYEEFKQYYKTQ